MLMSSSKQGSGVDIWAAGVIMLSMMSRRYPFFTSSEAPSAIAEIFDAFRPVLGTDSPVKFDEARDVIVIDGMICSFDNRPPRESQLSLVEYCRACSGIEWPQPLVDLMERMTELDPAKRVTASEALDMAWNEADFAGAQHAGAGAASEK